MKKEYLLLIVLIIIFIIALVLRLVQPYTLNEEMVKNYIERQDDYVQKYVFTDDEFDDVLDLQDLFINSGLQSEQPRELADNEEIDKAITLADNSISEVEGSLDKNNDANNNDGELSDLNLKIITPQVGSLVSSPLLIEGSVYNFSGDSEGLLALLINEKQELLSSQTINLEENLLEPEVRDFKLSLQFNTKTQQGQLIILKNNLISLQELGKQFIVPILFK